MLTLILILVRHWVGFPGWLYGVILGVWILKIILLYPLVRSSYLPYPHKAGASMIGKCGIAREPLEPRGRVSIRGELWLASLEDEEDKVKTGETVRVLDVKALTLIVAAERMTGKKVDR